MSRRYVVLDVFTAARLEGNPLAVVLDAEGLDTTAMQKIAREFNLSETVFLLPPENAAHSAALRIFTPGEELPFAGHPTVGTTALLAEERFGAIEAPMDSVVVVEEKVGVVRAAVRLEPGRPSFAEFDLPRKPHPVGRELPSKGAIADALGLDSADIGFENHVPSAWEAGSPYAFVPLAGLDSVRRIAFDLIAWKAGFGKAAPMKLYVYTRETLFHDSAFHARMFGIGTGAVEDPATGAAAAAFSGAIVRFDAPTEGSHRFRIEQGFEMGRPSLIDLTIEMARGELAAARIGGRVVRIAEGNLLID